MFDMLNALVPCVLILIMFAAFNVDGYNGENLAAIFLLLVCNYSDPNVHVDCILSFFSLCAPDFFGSSFYLFHLMSCSVFLSIHY